MTSSWPSFLSVSLTCLAINEYLYSIKPLVVATSSARTLMSGLRRGLAL